MMQRAIVDYGLDEEGDWYAVLDCAHRQHVRHQPPFNNREWVTTRSGRNAKLGELLDCVRCDRREWPDGLASYKRTKDFDQDSIPRGLLADHKTAAGVWAKIIIEHGALRYHVDECDLHQTLKPDVNGVVVAQQAHRIEACGDVRFFVEFHRRPKAAPC